jgi:WD40 repeat protein
MSGVNGHNIVSVAIIPDGSLLAAAYDDNTIRVWDIATKDELMILYGHNSPVTDLRFTVDGKFLISTSLDGTIRIWGDPD